MKKIFFILLFTVLSFFAFAIPAVEDIIPTESGQYVFYRDYSFTTETYIGFLQYDEETFSIRYYAPNATLGSSNIELAITIDPKADYILMTGEKIVSQVTMDDNTTINYLHDLFYELSARRKKIAFNATTASTRNNNSRQTLLGKNTIVNDEEYFQYGGSVTILYDYTIPIFNVRNITSKNTNSPLLQAVTMGQITDYTDTSFWDFKGFPSLPPKEHEEELSTQDLESLWDSDNSIFWFIDDDALLYSYDTEIDLNTFENKKYTIYDYFSRKLSLSTEQSYAYLPSQKISLQNGALVVTNVIYTAETGSFFLDTKILKEISSDESSIDFSLTGLSAFYPFYYSNEKYFSNKIKELTES